MKRYLQSVEEVVKLLKEGQLITSKLTNRVYQMSNGIIYSTYKGNDTTINDSIYFAENVFYTEELEPLRFEINRAYKTSNGEKVFLYSKIKANEKNFLYFIGDRLDFHTFDNGKFLKDGAINIHNIVGYWEEEK